jgi:predicted MFS family arabinose efflux permease
MWLFALLAAGFQIVPASFLPVAMSDLDVGPALAGWLVSASLAAQALGNVPLGVLIDRTSDRVVLFVSAAGIGLSGVGAWLAADAGAFWPLVGAIAVGGVFIAGVITAGADLVGAAFDAETRATGVAAFVAAPPAGYALGQAGGPLITARFGWPVAFLAFGVGAAAVFLLLSPFTRGVEAAGGGSIPSPESFRRLLSNRAMWVIALMGFLAYSLYLLFNSWLPSYLSETLGTSLAASGLFAALFPVSGVVARGAGGVISDAMFDQRRRPVAIGGFVLALPMVGAIVAFDIPVVLGVVLLGAGFVVQLSIGLLYTYVQEVVAEDVTGTALATLGLVSFAGAFSAPVVAGLLITRTGDFDAVFVYAGALAVVGVVLALAAPEPSSR